MSQDKLRKPEVEGNTPMSQDKLRKPEVEGNTPMSQDKLRKPEVEGNTPMSQDRLRRPELKGKDDNGCCPSCASREFEVSSPYQTEDEDQEYQDAYCSNCGTVIRKQTP